MEGKKQTNAQLKARIDRAIIHVDRTRDTKETYFGDRGIRITVNEDIAIISNGIYTTMFHPYYFGTESNQYKCLKDIVDLAYKYEKEIIVKDSKGDNFRSFKRLSEIINEKEDEKKSWFTVFCWYMFNFEAGIALAPRDEMTNAVFYSIYENYAHSGFALEAFSKQRPNGLTVNQYFREIGEKLLKIADEMPEAKMFEPMTDEQRLEQEQQAMQDELSERIITEGQADGNTESESE